MRPLLKPALRRLWRDGSTLQLGIDPGPAYVLQGLSPQEAAFVLGLDGTSDRRTSVARASAHGLDEGSALELLDNLAANDALDDADVARPELRTLTRGERDRLAPDLAALTLTQPGPGAAAAAMGRRRSAVVCVEGAGRVGAIVVGLLAAGGVGRVVPVDASPLRPADLTPGGPGQAELGLRRDEAAVVAARRTVPGLRCDPAPARLTVLAPDGVVDPSRREQLTASGLAHLPVTVLGGGGAIGPLVRPGVTPCLRCLDLHHTDRDPAWPVLVSQLTTASPGTAPCDITLATLAAAVTARMVLAFLDEATSEATQQLVTTYVVTADATVPRARSYGFHPACGCRWDERT